jgi:MYXO-CTERM domain-containing protein
MPETTCPRIHRASSTSAATSTSRPVISAPCAARGITPATDPSALENDIALVFLEEPVLDVRPIGWSRISGTSVLGQDVRFVGFGYQEIGPQGAIGQKMQGLFPVSTVDATEIYTDISTCNGDSGGPALFRFPDGEERVVGITSWGSRSCGGRSAAERVDIHAAWIDEVIASEDPASCGQDWQCTGGCDAVDPDCPCDADGTCDTGCPDLDDDPDCPRGCGENGTCLGAECPVPDPDCGDPCGAEGHCLVLCETRDPDCAAAAVAGTSCLRDFDCLDGQCLPDDQGDKHCETPCAGAGELCADGFVCERLSQTVSVCRALPQATGCAAAPGTRGHAPLGLLLLVLVFASRRRSA